MKRPLTTTQLASKAHAEFMPDGKIQFSPIALAFFRHHCAVQDRRIDQSEPPQIMATIHVDGADEHVQWHQPGPLIGEIDVYAAPPFNLQSHLARQRSFSERTFGPGQRTAGIVDHIRKELIEVLQAPDDISEWVDVIILAFDGAWRAGATAEQVIAALQAKQTKNEGRNWPDWRAMPADKAIEHDRSGEVPT